jgi:hypothetical protein
VTRSAGWRDVSARVPCAGCGRHDWCQVSADGEAFACHRVPSDLHRVNAGGDVWLHFTGSGPRTPRPRPELPPPPPVADVQTRDRVYRALLSVLGLSDAHRAGLAARGLTPDAIGQGGYASLPAPASRPAVLRRLRAALDGDIPADVPGLHQGKLLGAQGLLIPARDATGAIVALKVRADDASSGKYLWLSSARQGGASPGAPCHVPVWTGPVGAVRVTEGPLKADVATRLSGRLTLGVPGVTAVRSAVPALRALGATRVVLAWDSDAASNAHVGRSLARAVEVMREEGFGVALETWAPEHKGIDDALAAGAHIETVEGVEVDDVVAEIVGAVEPVTAAVDGGESAPDAPEPSTGDDWRNRLTRGKGGGVRSTYGNLCLYLQHLYGDRLRFNEMVLQPEWRTGDDWGPVDDGVVGRLRAELEMEHGVEAGADNVVMAMRTVADQRRAHPVREYLEGLEWDAVPRIGAVLATSLGVPLDAITQRKLTAFMVSCVARAFDPGCKVDTVLVLVGPQGARKSSFFRELAGDRWFVDTRMDLRQGKDAYMQARFAWVYEWPEVDGITDTHSSEAIKAFLTSAYDTFRPPYGRSIVQVPRGNVFVGTTNTAEFLSDSTGNRRWWPVTIPPNVTVNVSILREMRDKLWGEAVALYHDGYEWWLSREEAEAHERTVEHHRLADPWESQVGAWLSREWGELKVKGALLTTHVVLTKALGLTPRDMTDATTKRASRVLRSLGFVSKQMRLNAAQASRFHSLTGVERDRVQVWVAPEQGEELATGEETRDADDYPN